MKKKVEHGERNPIEKFGDLIETRVKESIDKIERILNDEQDDHAFEKADEHHRGKRSSLFYLKTFLKDEKVATVHPSSKYVIKRVLKGLALTEAETVVEYGPADGVMSKRILDALPPHGTLVAIERNEAFYKALAKIDDPRLKAVHGDVQQVETILKKFGIAHVDRIVSGIPFSFLTAPQRETLLAHTARALKPGGRFIAYQFTTHLIPLLKRHFHEIDTQFEIRNLPPHFVFTCIKKK